MICRFRRYSSVLIASVLAYGCGDNSMMTVSASSSTADPTESSSTTTGDTSTTSDLTTTATSSGSTSTETTDTTSASETTDSSGGDCGDGILDDGEECEPALTEACNDACLLDRWVFVSKPYTSSFNNILNIDNHCLADAIEAGLVPPDTMPLDYVVKAWVSSATEWPAQDFEHHNGRFVLLGESAPVVAENWAELVSGQLGHAIDRDVYGEQILFAEVATNTMPDGTPASTEPEEMCDDWTWDTLTLPAPRVTYGEPEKTDSEWTQAFLGACDVSPRFYCFQQELVN